MSWIDVPFCRDWAMKRDEQLASPNMIFGFLQDIVRGVGVWRTCERQSRLGAREFKKSLDFIDQSADDRGRVTRKEGQ